MAAAAARNCSGSWQYGENRKPRKTENNKNKKKGKRNRHAARHHRYELRAAQHHNAPQFSFPTQRHEQQQHNQQMQQQHLRKSYPHFPAPSPIPHSISPLSRRTRRRHSIGFGASCALRIRGRDIRKRRRPAFGDFHPLKYLSAGDSWSKLRPLVARRTGAACIMETRSTLSPPMRAPHCRTAAGTHLC